MPVDSELLFCHLRVLFSLLWGSAASLLFIYTINLLLLRSRSVAVGDLLHLSSSPSVLGDSRFPGLGCSSHAGDMCRANRLPALTLTACCVEDLSEIVFIPLFTQNYKTVSNSQCFLEPNLSVQNVLFFLSYWNQQLVKI